MKFTVSHNNYIPLHLQVTNQIRQAILENVWPVGSQLPSEDELEKELNISRTTIRKSLYNLEIEGLIISVPGRGRFVKSAVSIKDQNKFIGFVTVDLFGSYQYQMLRGVEKVAKEKNYKVVFCNSNNDINEENLLLDQLLVNNVSGVVLFPAYQFESTRRIIEIIKQQLIPVVLIDRPLKGVSCDFVSIDNYKGAYDAVLYLIGLGHKKIVFLCRPLLSTYPISERLRGYRQAMIDSGLEAQEPWIVGTPNKDIEIEYVAEKNDNYKIPDVEDIKNLLMGKNLPSAVFSMNDFMAILFFKAAKEAGIKVPGDISLVGFDNLDMSGVLEVPLTTVIQDTFEIGEKATEFLIDRIEGNKSPVRNVVVPTKIKKRSSVLSYK